MTKWIPLAFVLIGIALIAVVILRREPAEQQVTATSTGPGTHINDFTLTNRLGKPFSASQLQGKVWVASFFYTSCPATCLKQNQAIAKLAQQYGKEGVKFVSITCDPENDTPENLQAYATKLQAIPGEWFFLTGDMVHIRQIGVDSFQMPVQRQTHSNRLMLIDKWGNLRGRFNWEDPREFETLTKKIRELQEENSPPAEKKSA